VSDETRCWHCGNEGCRRCGLKQEPGCSVCGRLPVDRDPAPSHPAAETLVGDERPAPRLSKPEPVSTPVLYEAETLGLGTDE
jgi:hypothetical protein